ncbi:malectin domain-containing carbohydrate-binding protein [Hymenobacter nivis]|uniref:malectin domain-containing carbohydrate-binding protein n=1 Tax=Hymenobacter nivis TaxID=1850093 RepID=UPI001F029648|nr:malectin domain-containing carbohydrate-binding protein [Hymenobacter nivis]
MLGDLDSDGDLDLLAIQSLNPSLESDVRVLFNDGAGIFSSGQVFRAGRFTQQLALGDVDADGDLDVVDVHVQGEPGAEVYLNNGAGSFTYRSSVAANTPYRVTLGDVDNDGDLDLATVGSVRLNNGQGVFTGGFEIGAPGEPHFGDIDGDGDLDLLTAGGTVSVYLNNGLGQFSNGQQIAANSYDMAVGDVDGDGDLDLLTGGNNSATLTVRLNNGAGTFSSGQAVALDGQLSNSGVAVSDLNGDNTLDFLATAYDGVNQLVSVRLNQPLPAPGIVRRFNAGGGGLSTSRGQFAADQYFSASSSTARVTAAIAGTDDDALYQSERYSTNGQLGYAVPVANGRYTVVLHFAETYWTQPGQRVFNIELEGTTVRTNFDIVAKVGPLTATTETFAVNVTDGFLNLDLRVPYLSGGRDQAKLSAVEVIPIIAGPVRLNAGGPALTTSRDAFAADQYFAAASATATTAAAIAGTDDDALYQSERYSTNGQLSYAVPVANGAYRVVLHFAETYWTQAGQRVFNIVLENTTVRTNFDIVAKVGPLTATTETFVVNVTDGLLNLDLQVPYLSGGRDQAKLSAVEVLPAASSRGALAAKGMASPRPVFVLQPYPNPVTAGRFTLAYTAPQAQASTLTLVDQLGRTVHEQEVQLHAGPNQVPVQLEEAKTGLYQLVLRTADGQRIAQKLIVR